MATQKSLDEAYMACARAIASLSKAERKKVGAIIVWNRSIIAEGFNGTPSGFDNCCEFESIADTIPETRHLTTKPEVIHAEANAIAKVARSTNSSEGATLYCTLSPCFECAKQIIQAGILRVVYAEKYPYAGHTGEIRLMGLELLEQAKISVEQLI